MGGATRLDSPICHCRVAIALGPGRQPGTGHGALGTGNSGELIEARPGQQDWHCSDQGKGGGLEGNPAALSRQRFKGTAPPDTHLIFFFLPTLQPPNPIPSPTPQPQLHPTRSLAALPNIMARSKKPDEKPKDSGSLQISVEDFVRTRNSVSKNAAVPLQSVWIASRLDPCVCCLSKHCRVSAQRPPPTPIFYTATTPHSSLPHHPHCHASLSTLHDAQSTRRGS